MTKNNKKLIGSSILGSLLMASSLYGAPNKDLINPNSTIVKTNSRVECNDNSKTTLNIVLAPKVRKKVRKVNRTVDKVRFKNGYRGTSFFNLPEIDRHHKGNEAERLEHILNLKGNGKLHFSVNGENSSYFVRNGVINNNFKRDVLRYRNHKPDTFNLVYNKNIKRTESIPKPVVMDYSNKSKTNIVKTPQIKDYSHIKGLNGLNLESKLNKNDYLIYYDHDDKKDSLKVYLIPGQDKELVKVKYGNGKSEILSLDKVRSDILKTFEFTDRNSVDKVTQKYLMAADGSGKEALRFMIDSNKYSTRMTDEKNVNANTQTRLSNAGAVIGFVDKVANAEVRGEYIVKNFIKKYGNNWTIKDNKFARNVYAGSFSDDVSFGRWFGLGFIANSAIYTTFTSDFLPRIEEDAALAQSRGANMNTYAVKIQDGGVENLLNNSMKAYKGLVEMYNGNIEATRKKMRSNQF